MSKFGSVLLAAMAATVAWLAFPAGVLACSRPPRCSSWVFPVAGELQSDRFVLTYRPAARTEDGGVLLPRLTRMVDGGVVDVPFEASPIESEIWRAGRSDWLELAPLEALPEGAAIVLETDQLSSSCVYDELLHTEYRVVAPQPLPGSLGTLEAITGRALEYIAQTSDCHAIADVAYADVRLTLDTSAAPWASLFTYTVFVDGKPHQPWRQFEEPWRELQPDARIRAVCSVQEGAGVSWPWIVAAGTHTVRLQAAVDGISLSTPEIQVELRCDRPQTLGPSAGFRRDAGAGHVADAGNERDAAAPLVNDETADAEADGCQLASPLSFNGVWFALALVLGRVRRVRGR